MNRTLMTGAAPLSLDGGPVGVLVLHGFTGNPVSVRPLAEGLSAAGFSVEVPLLTGHGTSVEDMLTTSWADWSRDAEDALARLAARTSVQVVAGLSMGGSLSIWLATNHPELAALVCVNPATQAAPEVREFIRALIDAGEEFIEGDASDVADSTAPVAAYSSTPLRPLLSLFEAADDIAPKLAQISCPVLIFTSPQDHVVPPTDSDFLADNVASKVERVSCENSYHVATLDYDKQMIIDRTVAFINSVVQG